MGVGPSKQSSHRQSIRNVSRSLEAGCVVSASSVFLSADGPVPIQPGTLTVWSANGWAAVHITPISDTGVMVKLSDGSQLVCSLATSLHAAGKMTHVDNVLPGDCVSAINMPPRLTVITHTIEDFASGKTAAASLRSTVPMSVGPAFIDGWSSAQNGGLYGTQAQMLAMQQLMHKFGVFNTIIEHGPKWSYLYANEADMWVKQFPLPQPESRPVTPTRLFTRKLKPDNRTVVSVELAVPPEKMYKVVTTVPVLINNVMCQ